jgi:hypothetical protein
METQEMMEILLARMNASMKEQMQQITAEMKADRRAHQAEWTPIGKRGRPAKKICWQKCDPLSVSFGPSWRISFNIE